MAKKRINVMLSEEVLRDLREVVPARKRSEFIEQELKSRLEREKFGRVLERLRKGEGLKAEDYPHWATQEAFERWRKELWAGTQERMERRSKEAESAEVSVR
jgi:hypothetical protein